MSIMRTSELEMTLPQLVRTYTYILKHKDKQLIFSLAERSALLSLATVFPGFFSHSLNFIPQTTPRRYNVAVMSAA
jgi:hypothetical protein